MATNDTFSITYPKGSIYPSERAYSIIEVLEGVLVKVVTRGFVIVSIKFEIHNMKIECKYPKAILNSPNFTLLFCLRI